jgi:hypothetical protein
MGKYYRAEQDTDNIITWRLCIACCITKATNTLSEHAILIAFPPQQWLHERASVLHYTYTVLFQSLNEFPARHGFQYKMLEATPFVTSTQIFVLLKHLLNL